MKKFKLGYAPTRRFVFSAEDAFKYKVLIKEKIESFGMDIDIVDLEGINNEGLLYDDNINADLIADRFQEGKRGCRVFPSLQLRDGGYRCPRRQGAWEAGASVGPA